ncbi:glycosyltransferase family 2 protein [Ovoidimarina sediminis]|uniref:glycosyltransferase family 2 protein n=1 Tax=Ovoidimarina sediminis TaxID=3079856 RepID=UPI002909535C|nr:glycosyltransferase family 2 protein [Rhodophyticola sp. MJ-SS7]MDU8943272.1 glycosyltransferase family 2 protein [Rhodophyticola sp. MJ-SS7]
MSRGLRCSIVVPHLNDLPRLTRCLDALLPQLEPGDEVIVVDNGSDFDVAAALPDAASLRVLTQSEPGAGPARNMGVAAASGEVLLFIDCDCVPGADWVAQGRRIAREGVVTGGRVDIFYETPPPRSGAEAFEAVFAFRMDAYLQRDGFLGAGNLCMMRADFDGTGGFRPAVAEDVDWSRRAAAGGLTLAFDDGFVVSHPSRRDWAALRAKWWRLTREAWLLGCESGGFRATWALKALAMPVSILAHAPRIVTAGALSWRERALALVTLARLRLQRMVWMLGYLVSPPARD